MTIINEVKQLKQAELSDFTELKYAELLYFIDVRMFYPNKWKHNGLMDLEIPAFADSDQLNKFLITFIKDCSMENPLPLTWHGDFKPDL